MDDKPTRPKPVSAVLDDAILRLLAESVAPAQLASADRESMRARILGRLEREQSTPEGVHVEALKAADETLDPSSPSRATLEGSGSAALDVDPSMSVSVNLAGVSDEPPPGTHTLRAADMRWLPAGPGVEIMVVRSNAERNDQTVLIRMQPGSEVIGHRHTQEEECLILEGEVFVGGHRLGRGDMHVASPGAVHAPIRSPAGALLLIRSEIPPQNFRMA